MFLFTLKYIWYGRTRERKACDFYEIQIHYKILFNTERRGAQCIASDISIHLETWLTGSSQQVIWILWKSKLRFIIL